MKGTSEEGMGRGMDGGREEASGGGIERGREGNFKGGIWLVYNIFTNHPTTRPLPLILCDYK